ncbi:Chaperone protein [Wickerhamomyces ciferrii]|uniref:Chaperone protein n=1 Tax=Wickerhamomyces ciferrii (strain ATCC 14091 / BCRC 22168 / CBS 111 / JCM 3599 / NBRC 0793 / NRRL Y-1031 F-60-10) TaxID=1206466 RepID=K0KPK9_WICCF|nr:Chaperone protein [Wickerhamomyces ciferrii]CCH44102.1 Chaperone protein [Wickerhamomyces ciferrii]
MVSKDIEYLKEKNFDIYKLLEIPNDAQDVTIRKAYRKQALIYHPDKNHSEDAVDKFHAISISLKVLIDQQLRNEYDNWLQSKQLEALRSLKLDSSRKQMKDELEKAENEAIQQQQSQSGNKRWSSRTVNQSSNTFGVHLEALRQEGTQKRRELEHEFRSKFNNDDNENLAKPRKIYKLELNDNTKVRVKWKIKEGISDLFTSDVLISIMSIFGDIESAEILPRSSKEKRYDTGIVKYHTKEGAMNAVKHNYNEKSKIWENTSYRKLSGLLREVKFDKKTKKLNKNVGVLNEDDYSFDEYLELTLMKLTNAKDSKSLKRKFEE